MNVLPIDDAMSFMLCFIIAQFPDLRRRIIVAIRQGLDLEVEWTAIFAELLLMPSLSPAQMGMISIATTTRGVCQGEIRDLSDEGHMAVTNRLVDCFIHHLR